MIRDACDDDLIAKDPYLHWLEGQVGVSYLVLRKHYGRYLTSEGPDQLAKMTSRERDGGVRGEESVEAGLASA